MPDYQPRYDEHGVRLCDCTCPHLGLSGVVWVCTASNNHPVAWGQPCYSWAIDVAKNRKPLPVATDENRKGGWTLSFEFLHKIHDVIVDHIGEEEIECVLLTADALLTAKKPEVKDETTD